MLTWKSLRADVGPGKELSNEETHYIIVWILKFGGSSCIIVQKVMRFARYQTNKHYSAYPCVLTPET